MLSFSASLTEIGREAARIVLCARCVVCESDLPWLDRVSSCCGSCWRALRPIGPARCARCAVPWFGAEESIEQQFTCIPCLSEPPPLDWIDAWGRYGAGLDRLLQAFKFARHDFLAGPLAEKLAEVYRTRQDEEFDAVVAVPMFRARRRRRGYNQAELLAREFARKLRIPHESRLLAQEQQRATQSSLPKNERVANVRGIYKADPRCAGRSVLLIDDICTTGATLRACAAALLHAKARRVCALVVARA